jgi:hypothetical protein
MENYGMAKPSKVNTLAILTLISGITNIIAGLVITVVVVVSTVGIGLLCIPLTLAPSVLGIFEIIYATKLMATPPRPVKNPMVIPILEICAILYGNVLSVVAGILGLVFGNEPEVQEFFQRTSM